MRKISILISRFDKGGAERTAVNLTKGLVLENYRVEILTEKENNIPKHLKTVLPRSVEIISLINSNSSDIVKNLILYLDEVKPDVLILWKGSPREVIKAKNISKSKTKFIVRVGTTFSQRDRHRHLIKRLLSRYEKRKLLKLFDLVIAVSRGVAEDIQRLTGIESEKIVILPNPTIVPEMFEMAKENIEHSWFEEHNRKKFKIILGAGGFRKSKDFPTLIKAFEIVKRHIPAKLILVGDGRQRKKIEKIIKKKDLKDSVWLAGFRENPYCFMAKSDIFVLSSRWEGSPNVLIEAMALGTQVVSTDCLSGPKEILENGKYGRLVPVGDYKKLAHAIIETLKKPLPQYLLKNKAERYDFRESTRAYIKVLNKVF